MKWCQIVHLLESIQRKNSSHYLKHYVTATLHTSSCLILSGHQTFLMHLAIEWGVFDLYPQDFILAGCWDSVSIKKAVEYFSMSETSLKICLLQIKFYEIKRKLKNLQTGSGRKFCLFMNCRAFQLSIRRGLHSCKPSHKAGRMEQNEGAIQVLWRIFTT